MSSIPQTTPYGIIYTVTNKLNGKQYVGQTIQPIERRWAKHISHAASGGEGCRLLWRAIRKYGPDAFDIEAIVACNDQEELNRMEAMAIEAGGTLSPSGYNLKTGGSNGRPSTETRARMSAVAMGRPPSPATIAASVAVHKGKSLSLEHRAKLSMSHKGKTPSPTLLAAMKERVFTPETRRKISEAKMGHPVSQETRDKLRAAQKGKTHSPETRRKISEAKMGNRYRKGHPHSQETRARISMVLMGHSVSPETRAKISAAHKKRVRR